MPEPTGRLVSVLAAARQLLGQSVMLSRHAHRAAVDGRIRRKLARARTGWVRNRLLAYAAAG